MFLEVTRKSNSSSSSSSSSSRRRRRRRITALVIVGLFGDYKPLNPHSQLRGSKFEWRKVRDQSRSKGFRTCRARPGLGFKFKVGTLGR